MVSPPNWTIPPDLVRDETPRSQGRYWHFPDYWESDIWPHVSGVGVKIAILDTGIASHDMLPEPIAAASFIRGESVTDRNGHGTHCAGTALGRNGIGAAPDAELIVGKVLSNGGSGGSDGITRGILYSIDEGADIISMSLGGGGSYGPTNDAIDKAFAAGCIVNAAAGNAGFNGRNTIGWPAKYRNCLCNAAIRSDGKIANFSSGGDQIDWATPGQDIVSASHRGGSRLVSMSGTSMATPFGSGVLALIVQLMRQAGKPHWTAADAVREFMQQFCEDRGQPGKDARFGFGVPEYQRIVEALRYRDLKWL